MLIAWFPMTGPSCSHNTTDIRHGRPVSYHTLRPESQLISLASGRGSFHYLPPGQEEAAPVWRTLEQHTRLELIHGARRRWLTGRHPPITHEICKICKICEICEIWNIDWNMSNMHNMQYMQYMREERVLASGVSFFAATLQPQCLLLGSSWQGPAVHIPPPESPIGTRGSRGLAEQHTRLELIHGARRRWVTGRHPPIL
jgi:hypothetical protein